MKPTMFIFLSLMTFFASCKQETPVAEAAPAAEPAVDMAVVKAEIQAFENQWEDATNKKDFTALMAMYADDAVSMPDDSPILSGKAAIEERLKKDLEKAKDKSMISFETLDVYGDGDIVTEFGTSTVKDEKGAVVSTGKYCAVFQKTDGKYLCIREIYNGDAPSK